MKHYYREHLKLLPKKGRKYSTTYIKQSAEHHKALQKHIQEVFDLLKDLRGTDPKVRKWCDQTLSNHTRKEGNKKGTKYSRWDCVVDAHHYVIVKGDEMTVAESNRWNDALVDSPGDQIEWVLESKYTGPIHFDQHFEIVNKGV